MTGISAHALSHVVRRHISNYGNTVMDDSPAPYHVNSLSVATTIFLILLTIFVLLSTEYSIGNLMGSLAMIESSTTTTIVEAQPPAYTDSPDAPLEKKALLMDDDADVEVVMIKHKPITSSIRATIKHLYRVGGPRARWRGLGQYILYHVGLNVVSHALAGIIFGRTEPLVGITLSSFIASMLLCRVHMLWTHAAISMPTSTPWYRRFVARSPRLRVLLLPTLVCAITQIVTLAAPFVAWFAFGFFDLVADITERVQEPSAAKLALDILRVLSGPAAYFAAYLFLQLPATATLVRIEACLLPADHETVVPFDREAIVGDLDLAAKGASGKLFASAWKTFTLTARMRVIKLYTKLFLFQTSYLLFNSMLIFGILYVNGDTDLLVAPAAIFLF